MAAPYTDEEIQWMCDNYLTLGPTKMADEKGILRQRMSDRISKLRHRLRDADDDRWLQLTTPSIRRRIENTDKIVDYGVVHTPNIYDDDDPRPVWLVIISSRFKASMVQGTWRQKQRWGE